MKKIEPKTDEQKREEADWHAWCDHFTGCGQCNDANNRRVVLGSGCVKGRALWTRWATSRKAFMMQLNVK